MRRASGSRRLLRHGIRGRRNARSHRVPRRWPSPGRSATLCLGLGLPCACFAAPGCPLASPHACMLCARLLLSAFTAVLPPACTAGHMELSRRMHACASCMHAQASRSTAPHACMSAEPPHARSVHPTPPCRCRGRSKPRCQCATALLFLFLAATNLADRQYYHFLPSSSNRSNNLACGN